MPHLDANALTDDPKGLEFLGQVIDVQADRAAPQWIAAETVLVMPDTVVAKVAMPLGRKRAAVVPEAA